jgi:D-glycero-D-manno-heptose 1,7-bisphosphate phosphatase
MSRRAIFLDRDGTLIRDRHFLRRPEELEFLPGVSEALTLFAKTGLALIVLSNQSGVARGLFGLNDVVAVNQELERQLAEHGIQLDAIYFCPHHPGGKVEEFRKRCDCRKPAPGMALKASQELDLELNGSWIVGDKPDDVRMSEHLPLRPVLVRTGYGRENEDALKDYPQLKVTDDLLGAAHWILHKEGIS